MMRTRLIRVMDVLTGLLVLIGVAFLIHVTLFATITLDAVRTGRLVAIGGAAVFVGFLLVLLELPIVLFVLFRRPGARLRVFASMAAGIVVFVGCYALADTWIVHKLPPRQSTLVPPGGGAGRPAAGIEGQK